MASTTLTIQDIGVNCMTAIEATNAVDNYNYLINILDSYDKSLLDTPFHPVFGEFSNFAELDRQEINKKIFTELSPPVPTSLYVPEDIKNTLISGVKELGLDIFASDNIEQLRKKRNNARSRVRYYNDKANDKYQDYLFNRKESKKFDEEYEGFVAQLKALRGEGDNINHQLVNAITEAVATGKWHYMGTERPTIKYHYCKTNDIDTDSQDENDFSEIEWDRGWYYTSDVKLDATRRLEGDHFFCTTKPVTVRQINPSAGINEAYETGYIMVGVSKHGSVLQASIVGEYVSNGYSSHPHLSSASICWGTAYTPMNNNANKREYNILTGLNIFHNLMEEYCPNNPYVTISDLKDQQEIMNNDRFGHAFSDDYLYNLPEVFCPEWLKTYRALTIEHTQKVTQIYDSAKFDECSNRFYNELYSRSQNFIDKYHFRAGSIYNLVTRTADDLRDIVLTIDELREFDRVNLGELGVLCDSGDVRKYRLLVAVSAWYHHKYNNLDVLMSWDGYMNNDRHDFDKSDPPQMPIITDATAYGPRDWSAKCFYWNKANGDTNGYYCHKVKYIYIGEE